MFVFTQLFYHIVQLYCQVDNTSWMPGLPTWLLAAALAQALGLTMKSIRGGRQVTVVAVLVELPLQGVHLLSQQLQLAPHLSDQRVSLRQLLLQQALFLSQVNHFFFGCHVPTVFGSGLLGKPSGAREE